MTNNPSDRVARHGLSRSRPRLRTLPRYLIGISRPHTVLMVGAVLLILVAIAVGLWFGRTTSNLRTYGTCVHAGVISIERQPGRNFPGHLTVEYVVNGERRVATAWSRIPERIEYANDASYRWQVGDSLRLCFATEEFSGFFVSSDRTTVSSQLFIPSQFHIPLALGLAILVVATLMSIREWRDDEDVRVAFGSDKREL